MGYNISEEHVTSIFISILNTEAAASSKPPKPFHLTVWCHVPK